MTSPLLRPGLSLHRCETDRPSDMPTNSWCNIDASTFQVRVGPGYSRYHRKEGSAKALYDCVAVDLYATTSKISNISRVIDLEALQQAEGDEEGKDEKQRERERGRGTDTSSPRHATSSHLSTPSSSSFSSPSPLSSHEQEQRNSSTERYLPQTIVVSCQIPGYPVEHAIWGRNPEDGVGFSLVFYYRQSAETRNLLSKRARRIAAGEEAEPYPIDTSDESAEDFAHLYTDEATTQWQDVDDDDLPPAIRLLHRFVTARSLDTQDGNSTIRHFLRDRLKGITRIANLEDANIAVAPKKLIQTYNSTPFLIRTTSSFFPDPSGDNRWFEINVDVHRFGYLARLGLSGVRERIRDVVFDWAFVIEGQTDEELPENILSAARLGKLEVTAATPLPEQYAQILAEPPRLG